MTSAPELDPPAHRRERRRAPSREALDRVAELSPARSRSSAPRPSVTSVTASAPPTGRAAVLLVGKGPAAVRRTRDELLSGGLTNPVVACADGDEASTYLLGLGSHSRGDLHPLPAVVVTELRLRLGSGLEVLRTVRDHCALSRTPVIVVGGDPGDDELAELHRRGADAYLSRHVADHALLDVIRGLHLPWSIDRVELPS